MATKPQVRFSFAETTPTKESDLAAAAAAVKNYHDDDEEDDDDEDGGYAEDLHLSVRPGAPLASPPESTSPTPKYASTELRGNLTREITNRDPLFYYEVVSVLGVGSMGSVAKVRKRDEIVGGSARKNLQDHFRQEKRMDECFKLPMVGGFFRYCLKDVLKMGDSERLKHSSSGSKFQPTGSDNSSILRPRTNLVEDYNDGHGEAEEESPHYQFLYAMKSIHLSRVTDPTFVEELRNEITILKNLDHPHIVKAIETFEHRHQLFIVMELCSGGDLYSRDPYTEEEAARIICSILSAISFMHAKNICHRDLKYENILFVNSSPKAEIKLIDFGLSKTFSTDELTEGVGTIYTMAPEVLKGKYTKQADLWSVGVIAFMLMSSQMPFYGRTRSHIVEQIMSGTFEFKGRRWKRISAQGKAFIEDLLVVDPSERATAEDALGATWLNRRYAATVRNPKEEELDSARNSLIRFANYSKLKKMALMVVAHKSTSTEIGILRKIFQRYDRKGKGQLNLEEFTAAMADAGFDQKHSREIFDGVDVDGTGIIRYTEFLAATIEAFGAISEERLAEAFDRIDSDDSGYISKANLREMLGADFPEHEIEAIIAEADTGKDGQISYAEFLALWENKSESRRADAMKEIAELATTSSDRSGSSSEGAPSTFEEGDEKENAEEVLLARANFIEGRKLSERKATNAKKTQKHVLFQETVTTIPTTIYEADAGEPSSTNGCNIANDPVETEPLNDPAALSALA